MGLHQFSNSPKLSRVFAASFVNTPNWNKTRTGTMCCKYNKGTQSISLLASNHSPVLFSCHNERERLQAVYVTTFVEQFLLDCRK